MLFPRLWLIIPPQVGDLYRFRSLPNDDSGLKIMMPLFASSLLRSLRGAGASRQAISRFEVTEFPLASQNVGNLVLLEWAFRGQRAADRASSNALCPSNHWLKIENQNELAISRETPTPFARRIPKTGWRSSSAATIRDGTRSEKNIVLAAALWVAFWKWRSRCKAGRRLTQWLASTASTATTAAPAAA